MKYQVQVIVQNNKDYSTFTKQWEHTTNCTSEQLEEYSNYEVMYDYLSNIANSNDYTLVEILDWTQVD